MDSIEDKRNNSEDSSERGNEKLFRKVSFKATKSPSTGNNKNIKYF